MPPCDGTGAPARDCMQEEAIETAALSCRTRKGERQRQGQGRIILPCGTGKSRIALRIVERLTEPGQVSAVLCPSIALVSQLRGEFLAHCAVGMNALAVCSDEGVAKDKDLASDPTADLGHASASEVKGSGRTMAINWPVDRRGRARRNASRIFWHLPVRPHRRGLARAASPLRSPRGPRTAASGGSRS